MSLFVQFILIYYIAVWAVICLYGLHRYWVVWKYIRAKGWKSAPKPAGEFQILPRVTVQLPMFNERHVAERIIETCCNLDYPGELLQIQVLEDSIPLIELRYKELLKTLERRQWDNSNGHSMYERTCEDCLNVIQNGHTSLCPTGLVLATFKEGSAWKKIQATAVTTKGCIDCLQEEGHTESCRNHPRNIN